LPLKTIGDLETLTGADIDKAKIILADESTALLDGTEYLNDIHQTIDTMFRSKKNASAQNTTPPKYLCHRRRWKETGSDFSICSFLVLAASNTFFLFLS